MFSRKNTEQKSDQYKNWKELYDLFGADEQKNTYNTSLSRDDIYKKIMKKKRFEGTNIQSSIAKTYKFTNITNIEIQYNTDIFLMKCKNMPDYYMFVTYEHQNCPVNGADLNDNVEDVKCKGEDWGNNYDVNGYPGFYFNEDTKFTLKFNINIVNDNKTEYTIKIIIAEKLTPLYKVKYTDEIDKQLRTIVKHGKSLDKNNLYINSNNEVKFVEHNDKGTIGQFPNFADLTDTPTEIKQETIDTYFNVKNFLINKCDTTKNYEGIGGLKCENDICTIIEEEKKEEPKEEEDGSSGKSWFSNLFKRSKQTTETPETAEAETTETKTEPEAETAEAETETPETKPINKDELKKEVIEYVTEYINKNGDYDNDKIILNKLINKYRESLKSNKFNFFSTDPAKKISKSLERWSKNDCSSIDLRTLVESIDDKTLTDLLNYNEVELFKSKCGYKPITIYTNEKNIDNIKNNCNNGFDSSCKKILNKLDNLIIKIEEEKKE
jgi:hypothetical protein